MNKKFYLKKAPPGRNVIRCEFKNNPSNILSILNLPPSIRNVNLIYNIPTEEMLGNIMVSVQTGTRKDNSKEIIIFQVSLRGYSKNMNMDSWFEKAHNLLIENFSESITKEAKKKWELE